MTTPTKLMRSVFLALALLLATPLAGTQLGILGVSAAQAAVSKISISGNSTAGIRTVWEGSTSITMGE